MTMISFFSPDRKGYYEALDTDSTWQHFKDDAILVTPSPGSEYAYNFATQEWEKTEASVRKLWQPERNQMLLDTAWLIGTDSPLSPEDEISLRGWRLACEKMFDLPPADVQAPVCPDYVLPWITT